jgi:hypothetical protein
MQKFLINDSARNKFNTVVVFVGIIPFFFFVYLLLGPVVRIIHEDYTGEPMQIISENLKVRSDKTNRAYVTGQYDYGTEVKVHEIFENRWAEVTVEDIRGYMAVEYLVSPEQFYLIDGMYGNDYAKDAVRKTKYRKAIASYLSENRYATDIPKKIQNQLYGASEKRERWQFFAESPAAKFNTYCYGDFDGDGNEDAAYILKNIDTGESRLIVLDLNVEISGKYSKTIYSETLENTWLFVKTAAKGHRFITDDEEERISIDGILLGSNRDSSLGDTEVLLLFNGKTFEKFPQVTPENDNEDPHQ